MNYKNKYVGITGVGNGFIADQLMLALKEAGAYVDPIEGDIRDPDTFSGITYKYDYLFHFGAPSSQVLFKRKPEYCIDTTINGFLNASKACKQHGVKLIYPSTGLLSQGQMNEYGMCKKICEDLAPKDALGVRIFASYGLTESHKRDYASVPYLFIRDMIAGKSPVIFGDGEQKRDLIYITDVIEALLILAEECNEPIVDVGSGKSYSFNTIIKSINTILETDIKPTYIKSPTGYVKETSADITLLKKFYTPRVTLNSGILEIIEGMKK